MATTNYGTVQTQITRQDPAVEAYRLGLLEDVQQFVRQNISALQDEEQKQKILGGLDYNVAGLSRGEQMGIAAAEQGLGAYLPYVQQGSRAVQGGMNLTGMGAGLVGQAAQLAAAQRAVPYTYQQGAAQGLGQATQLGTSLGTQAFQGLNQAGQQGYGFAERGQTGADIAAERARASTAAAQQQLMGASQFGLGSAQQGIASLVGTGGMYDPSMTYGYMSPFENAAIQATLSDIGRQGEIAQQGVRAQAAQAGAFGGSRQAVAEQELQRNVLEQQARTAAQLRAQGFESAAQRSQQAFEQAQGRQQQLASLTGQLGQAGAGTAASAAQAAGQLGLSAEQLAQVSALQGAGLGLQASGQDIQAQQAAGQLGLGIGQLGQAGAQALGNLGVQYGQLAQQDVNQLGQLATQYGQLGGQMGQLGVQQAGMGEIGQNLTNAQLQNVFAAGGLERGVTQSQLDATRLSNLQRQQFPYQQYGFLSDIYSGVPSSQSTTTGVMGGQTSPFQQAIGLGISGLSAAAGAQRAGLFG